MFEVRVNGETVHQEAAQVIGISLMSARGELYHGGISTEGVVDVVLDLVHAGDPLRLDQLEAAQAKTAAAIVENEVTGSTPWVPSEGMTAKQKIGDSTTRPGGDGEADEFVSPPSVDLSQDLDPSDEATLTARVEAFTDSGDAQKAVDDNPPGSGSEKPAPKAKESSFDIKDNEPAKAPASKK
jgi:hypothetical protein